MYEEPRKHLHIAVLRGGKDKHGYSIKEGQSAISALTKRGIKVNDIYLDEEGNFIKNGVSTDVHQILAHIDGYIDTTDHYTSAHHTLAHKMGLKNLFSYVHATPAPLDREGVYRVLRQNGIPVPKSAVIRKEENDLIKKAKDVWTTFHTPLLVRPIEYTTTLGATLVKSFKDLLQTLQTYHTKGHDVQILSYKSVPTFATAVLPNYRGENYYTPIAVQTLLKKHEVPTKDSLVRVYIQGDTHTKEKIKDITKRVAQALQIKNPVCVDVIFDGDTCSVVGVDLEPSLRDGGRFMMSLASTGCDIAHYIETTLVSTEEE